MSSGPKPRRAKRTDKKPSSRPPQKPKTSDRRLYGVLGLVVAGLVGLVWWSLANPDKAPPGDAPNDEITSTGIDASTASELLGPFEATAEFAILTSKPEDAVRTLATVTEIGNRLDVRHCGTACDAVRQLILNDDAFELEVRDTADLLLPPKDTFDTVAGGLTPKERDSIGAHTKAVVIRIHGDPTPDQLPARAAFAAASILADALDGLVYDEVSRRIETRPEADAQVVTAALGSRVFDRRHVVVQLYRQEDGTARLLTLGMLRFGSPDLSLRGANMGSAPMLAEVLNAAASRLADGKASNPITITLEDVARVVGKKPAEISTNPSGARPVLLDIVRPERIEGDPDNEMTELVPPGGSSRESWDTVVASLFGMPASLSTQADDKELAEIARKARRELPAVIKRFEAGEGELFVKGPFPIPPDSRVDGGSPTELLWIAVASCDAERCTGVLSNEPTYATNIALGKTTSVLQREATDWVIHHRDGSTGGGESIKLLKARTAK